MRPLPPDSAQPANAPHPFRAALAEYAVKQAMRVTHYATATMRGDPGYRFQRLDPRFTQPGPFHVRQVGEGITFQARLEDIPEYSVELIRRYPMLSPIEQYRVRWAIALKVSWSFAELQDYRLAAFGTPKGPNPFADVAPYDVSMIARYKDMSPSQQLRVRYSVSQKESWTQAELAAYRLAAFGRPGDVRAGRELSGGPYGETVGFPRAAAGVRPSATTAPPRSRMGGPAVAASAFGRLADGMRAVASQARRAGEAMQTVRTQLPDLWGLAETNVGLSTVNVAPESMQI